MKHILTFALPLMLVCGISAGAGRSRSLPGGGVPAAPSVAAPAADSVPEASGEVPFLRRDTLFFYDGTQTADGFTVTTKVYVDADPRSENRRRLLQTASLASERDRRDLADNVRYLRRKHPGKFGRRDLGGIPTTWLPLVSVKGTLYIDGLDFYPVHLTDSLFIEQTQDGPWPSVYTRFERPDAGHLRFRTNSPYPPEADRMWDFYVIGPRRGIAVLAEHDNAQKTRYRLLAAEEHASGFGLLVWECNELPDGREVPRDTIDYRKLIETLYPEQP